MAEPVRRLLRFALPACQNALRNCTQQCTDVFLYCCIQPVLTKLLATRIAALRRVGSGAAGRAELAASKQWVVDGCAARLRVSRAAYPKVDVILGLSDQQVDLIVEGVDSAIDVRWTNGADVPACKGQALRFGRWTL